MEDPKSIIKQELEAVGFKEISFTNKGKLEGYEFLLSLYFPRTLQTIYFYKENKSTENIIVEFISMPQEWKGVRINLEELHEFIQHFIVTSNVLDNMGDALFNTWTREKTKAELEFTHPSAKQFKYFLGYHNMDSYSVLHRSFIFSPFVANYCFNEAADETSRWGCAQYRTAYSTSILNYEGYAVSKNKLLYYTSGSYLPSKFNKSRIIGKVVNKRIDILPNDFPVDLVGAFDTIDLKQMFTPEALLEAILRKDNKNWQLALEGLYVMLKQPDFQKYFSLILKSAKVKIRNEVAKKAILWKDSEMAQKAVKRGISKQIEKKLKENNLI